MFERIDAPVALKRPRFRFKHPCIDPQKLEKAGVHKMEKDEIPDKFMCAISYSVMDNPYKLPCDHVFQKSAIVTWINSDPEHEKCPCCRTPTSLCDLKFDEATKIKIEAWLDSLIASAETSSETKKHYSLRSVNHDLRNILFTSNPNYTCRNPLVAAALPTANSIYEQDGVYIAEYTLHDLKSTEDTCLAIRRDILRTDDLAFCDAFIRPSRAINFLCKINMPWARNARSGVGTQQPNWREGLVNDESPVIYNKNYAEHIALIAIKTLLNPQPEDFSEDAISSWSRFNPYAIAAPITDEKDRELLKNYEAFIKVAESTTKTKRMCWRVIFNEVEVDKELDAIEKAAANMRLKTNIKKLRDDIVYCVGIDKQAMDQATSTMFGGASQTEVEFVGMSDKDALLRVKGVQPQFKVEEGKEAKQRIVLWFDLSASMKTWDSKQKGIFEKLIIEKLKMSEHKHELASEAAKIADLLVMLPNFDNNTLNIPDVDFNGLVKMVGITTPPEKVKALITTIKAEVITKKGTYPDLAEAFEAKTYPSYLFFAKKAFLKALPDIVATGNRISIVATATDPIVIQKDIDPNDAWLGKYIKDLQVDDGNNGSNYLAAFDRIINSDDILQAGENAIVIGFGDGESSDRMIVDARPSAKFHKRPCEKNEIKGVVKAQIAAASAKGRHIKVIFYSYMLRELKEEKGQEKYELAQELCKHLAYQSREGQYFPIDDPDRFNELLKRAILTQFSQILPITIAARCKREDSKGHVVVPFVARPNERFDDCVIKIPECAFVSFGLERAIDLGENFECVLIDTKKPASYADRERAELARAELELVSYGIDPRDPTTSSVTREANRELLAKWCDREVPADLRESIHRYIAAVFNGEFQIDPESGSPWTDRRQDEEALAIHITKKLMQAKEQKEEEPEESVPGFRPRYRQGHNYPKIHKLMDKERKKQWTNKASDEVMPRESEPTPSTPPAFSFESKSIAAPAAPSGAPAAALRSRVEDAVRSPMPSGADQLLPAKGFEVKATGPRLFSRTAPPTQGALTLEALLQMQERGFDVSEAINKLLR